MRVPNEEVMCQFLYIVTTRVKIFMSKYTKICKPLKYCSEDQDRSSCHASGLAPYHDDHPNGSIFLRSFDKKGQCLQVVSSTYI